MSHPWREVLTNYRKRKYNYQSNVCGMTQEYVYLCQQIQFLKKFYLTYILKKKKKKYDPDLVKHNYSYNLQYNHHHINVCFSFNPWWP